MKTSAILILSLSACHLSSPDAVGHGASVSDICILPPVDGGEADPTLCPIDGGGGGGGIPPCTAIGCSFAPWGWCGENDSPQCTWNNDFSADPTECGCEHAAMTTCAAIGYPTAECWITFAQNCSVADQQAAYQHCLKVTGQPAGSPCGLQWR